MIVIPAIDIRRGHCVRLTQGHPEAETIFSDDPVEVARKWVGEGAQRLHVVNLDGAFGASDVAQANQRIIAKMARAVEVPIQLGGGLRSLADIEKALDLGVDRVILGTAAVEKPALVAEAVRRYGARRVLVGIDGRNGMVVTHGWQQETQISVLDLALHMKSLGITCVVYTDVQRDGMLAGINLGAVARLARESGLRVIASGGVRSIDDITVLLHLERSGVEGVIVGKALYTGAVELREALRLCEAHAKTAKKLSEV